MGRIIGLAPEQTNAPEETELDLLKAENQALRDENTELTESHTNLLAEYNKLEAKYMEISEAAENSKSAELDEIHDDEATAVKETKSLKVGKSKE